MSDMYIFNGKDVALIRNSVLWGIWMQNNDRTVRKEVANGLTVSTVFLGLDHAYGGGKPVLFETMVFGDGEWADYQERYHTYDEAVDGHETLVNRIMQGDAP